MDSLTRRRFLLDLLCVGGFVAVAVSQAEAKPKTDLEREMDKAIDRAFSGPRRRPHPRPQDPPPRPRPDPPHPPHPGKVSIPQCPPDGDVAPPPPRR